MISHQAAAVQPSAWAPLRKVLWPESKGRSHADTGGKTFKVSTPRSKPMTSLWNASKTRKDKEETAESGNSSIPESGW